VDGKHIITFKADQALVEAMEGVTNRSEFIRAAILAALDGRLPAVPRHRRAEPAPAPALVRVQHTHAVETCGDCHETRIVCKV